MKILGRILIILAVFGLLMGVMYVLVTSASAAGVGDMLRFGSRNEKPAPSSQGQPGLPAREERPESRGRERSQFRGVLRLIFGGIKNTFVIAVIVAMVVMPMAWLQRRRRAPQNSAK